MSTRATIVVSNGKTTGEEVGLYHHHDGYPEHLGVMLRSALRGANNHDCFSFATMLIKNEGGKFDDEFELISVEEAYQHDVTVPYTYIVDLDQQIFMCTDNYSGENVIDETF